MRRLTKRALLLGAIMIAGYVGKAAAAEEPGWPLVQAYFLDYRWQCSNTWCYQGFYTCCAS